MENKDIVKIKKIVCEAFCVEESDLLLAKASYPIKMAQYTFCYHAYCATMNKDALSKHLNISGKNMVNSYLSRYGDNLVNSNFRRIDEKIKKKIDEI